MLDRMGEIDESHGTTLGTGRGLFCFWLSVTVLSPRPTKLIAAAASQNKIAALA
jgi:hypothetical protein